MTPCKSDQTSDYLHVESSIRQGTPYSLLGDGILSGYKPNYQKVKRNFGTPPGHGTVPVSKMGHGGTSGNFGNKFNERNDLLTKMGPYNSSLQSEVEALGNVSCENGLSSALPSQQHGLELEQIQYSCQGIVTYLKDLLHKSEAIQSTLHGKVKDSYEVIQV